MSLDYLMRITAFLILNFLIYSQKKYFYRRQAALVRSLTQQRRHAPARAPQTTARRGAYIAGCDVVSTPTHFVGCS
jgi:hypothetical protein